MVHLCIDMTWLIGQLLLFIDYVEALEQHKSEIQMKRRIFFNPALLLPYLSNKLDRAIACMFDRLIDC